MDILDRSKKPEPGPPKDVHFPEHFESKTSNGIDVLVIENYKIPAVSVRLVFKNAGSYFDYGKYGLASLTAELLTKGTKNRSATEIAEQIDFLGASLSAGSDWDGSYVNLSSLKKHLNKAVDVLSDVVLNPIFSESEIKRVKDQRISSIIQGKDDTSVLSDKLFNLVVFDKHPYAFPQDGTEDSVAKLNYEDFSNFYNKRFTPDNLILAFVGAISAEEALKIVEEKFTNWHSKGINELYRADNFESSFSPKNVYIGNKTGAVQSSLKIGHKGIKRNNSDFIAVTVMNNILGGFFGSRINYNLREKHGFTYGARSSFNARILQGDFSVETEVRTEVTHEAVKIILGELKRIVEQEVTDDELLLVKNFLTGIFPLQLETANSVASRVINLKLYGLPDNYYNTYISNINKITRSDVLQAARNYLFPDACYVAVSGDSAKIREELGKLGNVSVYDADGEQIP